MGNFFLSNFMDLWKDMGDFKKRAQDACKNKKTIKVIGHSLGAALARNAAMFLAMEQEIDGDCIKLVTFGEPRSTDSVYSENFLLKDFSQKNSPNFSKYHSCGYDDMHNAEG